MIPEYPAPSRFTRLIQQRSEIVYNWHFQRANLASCHKNHLACSNLHGREIVIAKHELIIVLIVFWKESLLTKKVVRLKNHGLADLKREDTSINIGQDLTRG